MRKIIDLEANNLLGPALDYAALPFKLKADFRVWCVVVRNIDTGAVQRLLPAEVTKDNLRRLLADATELIGHNIVNYDLPVLMLYDALDYTIGYPGMPSTLFGKPVIITDTLIWSKLLNADRLGGHSLDAWGKRLGNKKGEFNDWTKFSEEMLDYCIQDTNVNKDIYFRLMQEAEGGFFERAYAMETKLVDLTLRQELFGFSFNSELAAKNIAVLDEKMRVIAEKVNPILPQKRLTQAKQKLFTPPKIQLKKDGTISAVMQKFMDRLNITYNDDDHSMTYKQQNFELPYYEPLETHEPATVNDIDTVKGYLLSLGWVPTEVKERDLVKKADKSIKTRAEIIATIDRYVDQCNTGEFGALRSELLGVSIRGMREFLIAKIDDAKPIYVPASPKLAVGLEKEICKNLVALGEKAEFVKDVVEYFTFRHRRNAIAGGAVDEDGEPETGFLSYVRADGRIPTPADTLGANTGRYRHKIVCNIPRNSSLFGEEMRGMFGPGKGLYQLGYDFSSVEARVMGHYVMPYTAGPELAEAMIAVKPNDIHSVNSRKLGIPRDLAKSMSYAILYGAQPKKLAKMLACTEEEAKVLYNAYWEAVYALKELKAKLETYWEKHGKSYILGLDGRKLRTRSKHSLLNVLFQSGGALIAKWSLVRQAQLLEEKGLYGDCFSDTIKARKVWQMIQMHDEVQFAAHPKLLDIKLFENEEQAEAAKVAGCSGIGHGSKGVYLGYKTEVIEYIEQGIKEASESLKLRVPIGYEWIPGGSWAQCH